MEYELLILILLGTAVLLLLINLFLTIFKKSGGAAGICGDFQDFSKKLDEQTAFIRSEFDRDLSRLDLNLRNEIAQNREELGISLNQNRKEMTAALSLFQTSQENKFQTFEKRQTELNQITEAKLEKIRETTEIRIVQMQSSNDKKLDEMKNIVDEKLQESVEKRFNESFKGISQRLDDVFKGLGEMQTLANGVGDLKKVLTNVKTRGNLGEIQLGAILEEVLVPDQYDKNTPIQPNSAERVEFAVRLPGKDGEGPIYLAIDSKFPIEDYQRLLDAYENNPEEIESCGKQLETAVKRNAKTIQEKYICLPYTTDFAIMFIPTEGLYAEILRRPGLFEFVQREYRVTIVGPTTLVAFLNSLRMGFQTLAVEKRTGEIQKLLGAIKTEFIKFGDLLEKTRKKLDEAASVLDTVDSKTRNINRKLKQVHELPEADSTKLLGTGDDFELYEV
ncbi:DNA recombination protein RmuC [Methanimicrococcus blatticola]|uniref:DNA recombination protein RmuC n=1 Tax=Methanimicrococcus blatticola TaxID=91560 RepID=A0A484F5C6_9EURY|nr:DNA recombination protein RmuC [Methanimicrococcus blatticola]MBZ3935598.1 DNA recombination protein RmuC [Methanimicrococcus blatticola]MCC2509239.1 DNA recombination protein RmuC [Methanimicrococcus blatticola]TDQ69395.1 DNA recombination protein RmuC [Methanimicrococcus blatticola]